MLFLITRTSDESELELDQVYLLGSELVLEELDSKS